MKQKTATLLAFFATPAISLIILIILKSMLNYFFHSNTETVNYETNFFIKLLLMFSFFLMFYQVFFLHTLVIALPYYILLRWLNIKKLYSIIPIIIMSGYYSYYNFYKELSDLKYIIIGLITGILFWFFLRKGDNNTKEQFIIPVPKTAKVMLFFYINIYCFY